MPQAQTVSINRMRSDAVLVTRGFFTLAFLPAFYLLPLILPMVRDLPHIDLAPLRSPLLWLLVALTIAGGFAAAYGTARMTAPYLWVLVIGSLLLIAIGGAAFMVTASTIDPAKLARESTGVLLGVAAALLIPIVILFYWLLLLPTLAALRLLATRVPPDGTPLPTVLRAPVATISAENPGKPPAKRSPASTAFTVAAVLLGIAATVLVLWLFANEQMLLALVLEFAAIYFVTVLWRQGRKHAAVDAHAALLSDPRRPILYLRSFQDDPHMMDTEWDMVVRTGYGRAGRRRAPGPIARLIASMPTGILSTSGGRLEENLATVVAPIGPFVAIGAPGEPLPQLGAARAYFTKDTWQGAIIEWVDLAQLIIKVAGPTRWIRWELDTILDRSAWSKLIVLMPPSTPEDHAARWGNIVAELGDTPWRDELAGLDSQEVVALRLLDGGRLSVVTSDRRRMIDYVLAMRIMLHQIQNPVPAQS